MKSLIRFEDTYGMTDIFCASRGIDYYDTNLIRKIHKIDDETYISFGFGNVSCLCPTYNDRLYDIARKLNVKIR